MSQISSPVQFAAGFQDTLSATPEEVKHLLTETSEGWVGKPRFEQIDRILREFRRHPYSLVHARGFLTDHLSNVQFYGLSVYEDWINTKWASLDEGQRIEIANTLFDYAFENYKSLPSPVLNYLAKVIACIGRVEWPGRRFNFLERLLICANNPDSCMLGVLLLSAVSEEWISPSCKILSSRRRELREELLASVAGVFDTFNRLLLVLWDGKASELEGGGWASSLDESDRALGKAVLRATQAFFSWVPIDQIFEYAKPDLIFRFVFLNESVSLDALDCLNEMLGRNCYGPQSRQCLSGLYDVSLGLLSKFIETPEQFSTLRSEFMHKWTQFISLFVRTQLEVNMGDASICEFVMFFGKYTLLQKTQEQFLACLDIWEVIFTVMMNKAENRVWIDACAQVVTDFVQSLHRSVLFCCNGEELSRLESRAVIDEGALTEGEGVCELDARIHSVLNLVSQAYMLYPGSLHRVLMFSVADQIRKFGSVHVLMKGGDEESQRQVYYISKDTNTMVELCALMGSQFCQSFETTFDDGLFLIRTLIDMLNYISENKIYQHDLRVVRLYAETYGALRSFSEWIAHYANRLHDHQVPSYEELDILLCNLIRCDIDGLNLPAFPSADRGALEIVALSAAIHLSSIVQNVKYSNLSNLEPVLHLMHRVHDIASEHTPETQRHVHAAVALIFLSAWGHVASHAQQWDIRSQSFQRYAGPIIAPYESVVSAILNGDTALLAQEQVKDRIKAAYLYLTDLMNSCGDGRLNRNGLAILWDTVQRSITLSIDLFPYCQDGDILLHMLQVFIQTFETLSGYISIDMKRNMVSAIVNSLTQRHCLGQMINGSDDVGATVVTRLLKLFRSILRRCESDLVDATLKFCMESISPFLNLSETPAHVIQAFHDVLGDILSDHHAFLRQHEEYYHGVIHCFNLLLQAQDYNYFRSVIDHLRNANKKQLIFRQEAFWKHGYVKLLSTLFLSILRGDQSSLEGYILETAYQIIEGAGFDAFFDQFVPGFINSLEVAAPLSCERMEALRLTLGRETDMPTLVKNLAEMLGDLRCYCFQ
ncbi:exportin-6-like [Schistocerca gregaria]|uniref:exportin-6-like n=1 Tax=Schistocerca gregaria TaxID=7010 RepID=UPI00211DAF0E|nr:exportin-6-like [Schistocerca gregaria]XP_049850481.1 exportin-6-like [Schistocerca gregaria]XP_049850482.1 exportin-6-like [Schistocerca gregaria]